MVRELPERLLVLYLFCVHTNGSCFHSYQINTKFISTEDLKQRGQNSVCANIDYEREYSVHISLTPFTLDLLFFMIQYVMVNQHLTSQSLFSVMLPEYLRFLSVD